MMFQRIFTAHVLLLSTAIFISSTSQVNASSAPSTPSKGPGWFSKIVGANIPEDEDQHDSQGNMSQPPPPHMMNGGLPNKAFMPPPPPPPKNANDKSDDGKDASMKTPPSPQQQTNKQQQEKVEEVHHQHWNNGPNMPPPPQGWHYPQPQQWEHPEMDNNYEYNAPNQYYDYQSEIDHLVNNQQDLYTQIQNLTSTLVESERTNELHLSQIDLLMEQVADAEAYASAESNAALEFKANCTKLGETIHQMQSNIVSLEEQCRDWNEKSNCQQEEISVLKQKLKKKERELESMACGIEMARLEKQKEEYQAEVARKKSQKSKGFFAWLFGWGYDDDTTDESDEELEKLQEQARSTLLNALQAERANVEELEEALAMTQQNNSAIAEMVESRDSLIDELNDRVAVFEEDKVVLKAALRQLQKEMKEEAPKTKKLLGDLKAAKKNVKTLEGEIEGLKTNHTKELASFNEKLRLKDSQINETDSRMSMISVYVDQLEERLASFAMARRDIAIREEKCEELVNKTAAMEIEMDSLQNEMKLVSEEKEALEEEKAELLDRTANLELEVSTLTDSIDELKSTISKLESELEEAENKSRETLSDLVATEKDLDNLKVLEEETKKKLEEQDGMISKSADIIFSLQKDLEELTYEKDFGAEKIVDLESQLSVANGQLEELKEQLESKEYAIESLNQELDSRQVSSEELEEVHEEKFQPPPPPPPPMSQETVNDDEMYQHQRYGYEYQQSGETTTHEEYNEEKIYSQYQLPTESEQGYSTIEEPVPCPSTDSNQVETPTFESYDDEESPIVEKQESLKEEVPTYHEQNFDEGWDLEDAESSENEIVNTRGGEQEDYIDLDESSDLEVEDSDEEEHEDNEVSSSITNEKESFDDEAVEACKKNKEEEEVSDMKSSNDKVEEEVEDDNKVDQEKSSLELKEPQFPDGKPKIQKRNVPLRNVRKQISQVTGVHGFFTPKRHERRENVPFRDLRKQISKATGIHGFFTPSSKRYPIKKPLVAFNKNDKK